MKEMRATLTKREEVAEGTMAFHFMKPEGFVYQAGQSADWTLVDALVTDTKGNTRPFSIASAPHEEELMFATRMRDSAFKNTLKDAPVGMEIEVEGPFGSFFLHENAKRPAVLLAGGIGVTPFRSMVVDAAERKLPHNITLVYSNREEKGAPFLDELKALSAKSENFTFVPVMSDTEGYIDEAKIRTYVDLSASPIFYMAGPQAMVLAMRKLLAGMGISSDDIRFEEFSGY